MPQHLTSNTYKFLLTKVSRELTDLETFVKQRMTEGYWKIGKYIDEHLLANKERADYGATVLERLAKDVGRDSTSLNRALRFYRTYPILVPGQQLTWSHYRRLITIKDKDQRKKLEDQIIEKNWDTHKVQEYLNTRRKLAINDDKPIPQLTFTRGKLNIYRVVKGSGEFPLALDLGFRLKYALPTGQAGLPKSASKAKEGDILELDGFKKVQAKDDELFTYKAKVEKVIDGDTLLVAFDFGLDFTISQKLRLRGIDCPEMDTEEGKRAKRFVEARLKGLKFIIVKTYKDRTDKFDRYLADIFFGEAEEYLNQMLLNERLAVKYEG